MHKLTIGCCVEPGQCFEESDDCQDLIVAARRGPGRHASKLDAMLDDVEQLFGLPLVRRILEVRRRWQHRTGNARLVQLRAAVARLAAAFEVPRAA
jgi:hypothetical protein